MKRTAVKTVSDFAFRSDFTPPPEPTTDTADVVSVTASELAQLLSTARAEGLAAAQVQFETAHTARMDAVSGQLKTALENLVQLAACLDASHLAHPEKSEIKGLITDTCVNIVNGQRDLFADQ